MQLIKFLPALPVVLAFEFTSPAKNEKVDLSADTVKISWTTTSGGEYPTLQLDSIVEHGKKRITYTFRLPANISLADQQEYDWDPSTVRMNMDRWEETNDMRLVFRAHLSSPREDRGIMSIDSEPYEMIGYDGSSAGVRNMSFSYKIMGAAAAVVVVSWLSF